MSVDGIVNRSKATKQEVLAELQKILESPQFRSSKKCSRFFRHVVEAALAERLDCLKERTLGVDVFEREPNYDTSQDPIVRGTAGEVRKRLAQYYVDAEHAGELRLSLPPGTYVPEVHVFTLKVTSREPAEAPGAGARKGFRWQWIGLALPAVVGVVLTCGWWLYQPTPLDRFWAPVTKGHSILVCLGQPQLYTFRADTAGAIDSWFEHGMEQASSGAALSPVPVSEIVPLWDDSTALGDAQAFSRLTDLFARNGNRVDLRGERSVTLSDLRKKPAVFIGAFDNKWTLNLASGLRFYFEADEQKHIQFIRDRQRPTANDWQLVDAWPPGKNISRDYAVVTRVLSRTTEQTVVVLAGIAQYGTEAAAEFVTNPVYFERALEHAPREWAQKNIQIVLSTRVLSGVSGPPVVISTYFW